MAATTGRVPESVGAASDAGAVGAFIKRHAVPSYYVLAFATSWCGSLLVAGGPRGIPGTASRSRGCCRPRSWRWAPAPAWPAS
jgi:hypothetical protein